MSKSLLPVLLCAALYIAEHAYADNGSKSPADLAAEIESTAWLTNWNGANYAHLSYSCTGIDPQAIIEHELREVGAGLFQRPDGLVQAFREETSRCCKDPSPLNRRADGSSNWSDTSCDVEEMEKYKRRYHSSMDKMRALKAERQRR